jgi:hypothetical protein
MSTTQAVTIIDTKPIETKLEILKKNAEAIQVTDAETYALACHIAVDVRTEVKAIGFALDPGIESARRHLDELRNQKKAFLDRLTPIIDIATRKAEFWRSEERKKAQAEEDRINAERRKESIRAAEEDRKAAEARAEEDRKRREKELKEAQKAGEIGKREAERLRKESLAQEERDKVKAEREALAAAANVQEVKVAPAVPKVAGIKGRVNWRFRIINVLAIPGRFLQPNEQRIGEMVRATKDKAKAEAECPGIEVYSEDSV